MSKKQMSANLNHPVIMYGYVGGAGEREYDEAVRQWRLNFVSSFEEDACEEFRYDRVIFLENTNIRARLDLPLGAKPEIADLPIFHAGVVFFKGEYPVWIYLFQESSDMDDMLEQHPFNNFVLESGERYSDVSSRFGVRFGAFDRKEAPEWPPELEECVVSRDQASILSLPGWPSQEIKDGFLEDSDRVLEDVKDELPEYVQEMIDMSENVIVETPVSYTLPLPGMDFVIHHIAVGEVELKERGLTILMIQNNYLSDYDLGEYD